MHSGRCGRSATMSRQGERGVVLVAVLLAVAIMSVLVVAVTALTRSDIAGQRLEERLFATRLALRSGLETAKALIAATPPEQRAFFDGTPVELDLGQGIRAEITIRDAAGLADLNQSDIQLVSAILNGSLKPALAKSVISRIEELRKAAEDAAPQVKPAPPQGAKAPPQKDQAPLAPTLPGEQPAAKPAAPVVFLSTDQLMDLLPEEVAGDAAAQALGESFTVVSPKGLVNPFAAPRAVLAAIPGLTPRDIATIDAARKNRAWKSDSAVRQILERLKTFVAVEEPSVFMIGVRLTDGTGIIARSRAGAAVQALKEGPLPFRTLAVSGL